MPYDITWEAQGVYTRFYGKLSDAELIDNASDIQSHPKFETSYYQIFDFSDVTEIGFTVNAARIVGATDHASTISLKVARVRLATVDTTDKVRELYEIYRKIVESDAITTGYFTRLDEARQWSVEHIPRKIDLPGP